MAMFDIASPYASSQGSVETPDEPTSHPPAALALPPAEGDIEVASNGEANIAECSNAECSVTVGIITEACADASA